MKNIHTFEKYSYKIATITPGKGVFALRSGGYIQVSSHNSLTVETLTK